MSETNSIKKSIFLENIVSETYYADNSIFNFSIIWYEKESNWYFREVKIENSQEFLKSL